MEFQQSDYPAQHARPKLSDCPNGIHNKCEHDVVSDGRQQWQQRPRAGHQPVGELRPAGVVLPGEGTGNDTAGYLYKFNTTNYTLNDFSFDQRDSGGPSGWAQLQYSVNGGSTWETMSIPNPTNSPNIVDASGSSTSGSGTFVFFPNDHWSNQGAAAYNQPIDLTQLPDYSSINNNPNFEIREVAAFSPVAFTDSAGLHAANTAYMRADSSNASTFAPVYTSTSAYTNSSTWRVDMVTLTGTYHPPVFTAANLTWNTGSGVEHDRRQHAVAQRRDAQPLPSKRRLG